MEVVLDWILTSLVSASALGAAAYFLRELISRYFMRSIEFQFEQKLEAIRSQIRTDEQELDQMRSFVLSAKRERDSAFQNKKIEAAETLLSARAVLAKFSIAVVYMKILNVENILADGDNPKITELIRSLAEPLKIDETMEQYGKLNRHQAYLFLGDRSIKVFDAYESTIVHAAMMLKFLSIPLKDKSKAIKRDPFLSKKIVDLLPSTAASFEKWGESHAYYWTDYLYEEILKELRRDLSGVDDVLRDLNSIEDLAVSSRQAQAKVRASLSALGLSEDLVKQSGEQK